MDEPYPRDSVAGLTLRWRNGLAFAASAISLGAFEVLFLLLGQLPGYGRWLIGSLLGGSALVCGTLALHFLLGVRREEARLETVGTPRRADRSLFGTIRRSFNTWATPAVALAAAYTVLSDPELGLIRVGPDPLGGVKAIRPAETGLIVINELPLAVWVRARARDGRTEVTVSVVQSSVYGWPALEGWFAWSATSTWIGTAQTLADWVVYQLDGALRGSGRSEATARLSTKTSA